MAIAHAVAGRFDHYVCRRDDSLRDRAPDEVPRLQAAALLATGVREDAISIIPDEQEAIDAALRMGQPGDLLLVFADALVRSWKQITKFRPVGSVAPARAGETAGNDAESLETGGPASILRPVSTARAGEGIGESALPAPALNLEGLIRDERGVRFAPETED